MVLYHLSGAPPSAGAQRNFLTEQTANIAGNGTFHVLFLHFLLHIVAGLNIWGVCVGGGGGLDLPGTCVGERKITACEKREDL